MKTNHVKISVAAFFAALLVLSSCQSDEKFFDNENEEAQLAQQASEGDDESDDALEIVNDVEEGLADGSITGRVAGTYGCATVTHNTETNTVTIDFGTAGCVGPYGRTRTGKIIFTYGNGELGDLQTNRTVTFENYSVSNGNVSRTLNGQIVLRNLEVFYAEGSESIDSIRNIKELKNFSVSYSNGATVVYNGTRTRVWTGGILDGDITNNEYKITGEIEAVSSTGRVVTHSIVSPIISHWSCRASGNGFARIDGLVEITLQGFVTRTRSVNYAYPAAIGEGACDNQILITIGNREFVVSEN